MGSGFMTWKSPIRQWQSVKSRNRKCNKVLLGWRRYFVMVRCSCQSKWWHASYKKTLVLVKFCGHCASRDLFFSYPWKQSNKTVLLLHNYNNTSMYTYIYIHSDSTSPPPIAANKMLLVTNRTHDVDHNWRKSMAWWWWLSAWHDNMDRCGHEN